jgi:hypothetical protein
MLQEFTHNQRDSTEESLPVTIAAAGKRDPATKPGQTSGEVLGRSRTFEAVQRSSLAASVADLSNQRQLGETICDSGIALIGRPAGRLPDLASRRA